MLERFSIGWKGLFVRGVLAVIFGVVALFLPLVAGLAMIWVFGAYAIADGVTGLWAAATGRTTRSWLVALFGVVSLIAGFIALFQPMAAAMAIVAIMAAWAIVQGILEIVAAIQLRREIEGEWLLLLSGVISIAFGLLVLATPAGGMLAVVWLVALYALLLGILFIVLALRLRRWSGGVVPVM